jgi:hypothetical protein
MSEFYSIDDVMKSDMLREYFSINPKKVDPNSTTYWFYMDMLFRKAMSIYEFENIPDNWDYDYFVSVLLSQGFICVTDTALGVIPLRCGLSGINVYNHPTTAIIANPVLGNLERIIDEDCSLIKMNYNYAPAVMPIIARYATLLSECDSSISVNLMNSKVAFIGLCSSKQVAESMKAMYTKISQGEPAVFVKGDQINSDTILYNHVKENFIAGDVQILKRKLMSEFLTEIGVNNANTDKRERLTDNEVEANNGEIQLNAGYWLDNISEGIEKTNKMFGLNINVKLKNTFNTESEAVNNDNANAVI